MKIKLEKAGKRFNRDWIFRDMNHVFEEGSRTVILGGNGSGKSTLLKLCSAYHSLNEGKVSYSVNDQEINPEHVFREMSFAAPYIDLPGLFNLEESISFHFRLKKAREGLSLEKLIQKSGLEAHRSKVLRNYSSGMKQRVKLLLAICTDSRLLLLDEPSSNLDEKGIAWYNDLLEEFLGDRTLVIASNHTPSEFRHCNKRLELNKFKTQ